MNEKICLVEDEEDLNQILSVYLERNNYKSISCRSLKEAKKYLNEDIDLWVIDIMLTDGSGIELLKSIKSNNKRMPIILISARGDSTDRLLGFEIGCDDYIPKPFLPEEMIFRIDKILRNSKNKSKDSKELFNVYGYEIDTIKRTISYNQSLLDITSREFDIIIYFLENRSEAISREVLLERFWGKDYYGSNRVVDNYIKNIRRKLPKINLETIYSFGYRLI